MRRIILVLLGLWVMIFVLYKCLLAATIVLKTGERVQGEIVKRTPSYVQIKRDFGVAIYFMDMIEEIITEEIGEKASGQDIQPEKENGEQLSAPSREEVSSQPENLQLQSTKSTLDQALSNESEELGRQELTEVLAGEEPIISSQPKPENLSEEGVDSIGQVFPFEFEEGIFKKDEPVYYGPKENIIISSYGELLKENQLPLAESRFEAQ